MAKQELKRDQDVAKLPVPAKGNQITYDEHENAPRGFGVRVTANGVRSFILAYRRTKDGVECRMVIGRFPDLSLSAARIEAEGLRGEIAKGADPLGEKKAARKAESMAKLCEEFEKEHVGRKRDNTQRDYRAALALIRAELGRIKVADIEFKNVSDLHRKITTGKHRKGSKGAPYLANRTMRVLSKMFTLAIRWKLRGDNPTKGIEFNNELQRRRYIKPDELARLMKALAEHEDKQAANIVRLCLLTGARIEEIRSATWDQVDLVEGVWRKPASSTKQNEPHEPPLSAPARQLLSQIRREAETAARKPEAEPMSPYVFPSPKGKQRTKPYRAEIKTNWKRLLKAAQITGLRVHDLRHSFASIMASSGASLPLIGSLLGHSQPATTARYVHLFTDAQRAATDRVGAVITNAGKPSRKNVVPLAR